MQTDRAIGKEGRGFPTLSEDAVFQLRTHLNTIVMSAHVLGAANVKPEHLDENLAAIESSCEAVRRIVAEIRQS